MSDHLREVIAFPDIETLLIDYLTPLVGVEVSTGVPSPRPASFVLLRRTGGPRVNLVTDQTMLTVECWANDSYTAAQLASLVRAHVAAAPVRVRQVHRHQEFSGPASLPDPTSGQARYTWTVSLDVRGHAI